MNDYLHNIMDGLKKKNRTDGKRIAKSQQKDEVGKEQQKFSKGMVKGQRIAEGQQKYRKKDGKFMSKG